MAIRYRLHGRVRASQKAYRCLLSFFPRLPSFPSSLAAQPSETVGIRPQRPWVGGGNAGRVGSCGAGSLAAWIWSGGSAEVDVGDSGGGEAQRGAGGVGEAGQHAKGGQAAAAFDAGDRGLGGAHAPGQLGLGPASPGPQRVDQLGQLPGPGGRGVGAVVFVPVLGRVLARSRSRVMLAIGASCLLAGPHSLSARSWRQRQVPNRSSTGSARKAPRWSRA